MYVNLYEWCLLSCHQKQLNGFLKHAQLSLSAKLMCVRLQSLLKIPFSDQAHHIWSLDNWCMSLFGRLFQLSAGKVSHFQFQCKFVRLLLWFSLEIVKVSKKNTHLCSICISPKKSLTGYFSSKAHGWWIPAFLHAKIFDPDMRQESVSTAALSKNRNQKALWVKADKSDVQYSPHSQKQELDEK